MEKIDISYFAILLFCIIPGLIFRRFYYQGEFNKQYLSGKWAYILISSAFIGFIIQVIFYYLTKFGIHFNFFNYLNIVNYTELAEELKSFELFSINHSDKIILTILSYGFGVILLTWFLSIVSYKIVRVLKLDTSFKIFRFRNIWHYYFQGEILRTKDFVKLGYKNKTVLYTEMDILISDGFKNNKMFSGQVVQYTVNIKTNDLETITLINTQKWKTQKNKKGILK